MENDVFDPYKVKSNYSLCRIKYILSDQNYYLINVAAEDFSTKLRSDELMMPCSKHVLLGNLT